MSVRRNDRQSARVGSGLFLIKAGALLLLATFTFPLAAEENEASVQSAWDEAARLLVQDSYKTFSKLKPGAEADAREIDLGRAVTLINVQPKTASNIAEAERLLQKVLKGKTADEAAITSKYILGRIAQIHQVPVNEKLALERYTDLIETHPEHPLAQAARVKRAYLKVFSLGDTSSMEERFQQIVLEEPLLTDLGARRDFLLLLVKVSILTKQTPEVTLDYLLKAEACNNFRERARADIYVQIAEFAGVAGKQDLAITYYQKFLNAFVRDARRYLIEEKLAALQTGGPLP